MAIPINRHPSIDKMQKGVQSQKSLDNTPQNKST